ncbi:MAG: hypothetical protein Q8P99_01950 [bacterium]|nr:hypothetical protein [bacterium]
MKKDKLRAIHLLLAKVTPKMEVFGLEVSDGLVRFYDLGKGKRKARHLLLRLPPGVVVGGKVVSKEGLQRVLSELHKKVIGSARKDVSVIASIPINKVYIQPFALPDLAAENLAESAELNMRMISPIDANTAYYDWQELGNNTSKDKMDMVGAFVPRVVVDEFVEAMQGAGFSVVAVEFSALSLVRAAVEREMVAKDKSYLLLQIDQGGLSFLISHEGELYFHHFTDWDRYRGNDKSIAKDKFEEGLIDEARRLINFYATNFKSMEIGEVIVVADSFTSEVAGVMEANFKSIQIRQAGFDDLNAAMGAAFRGAVPRSRDTSISLSNLNAVGVFRKNQLANFIAIWRNIAFTVFGALLLIFLSSALVLQNTAVSVVEGDPFLNNSESTVELVSLEQQVKEFNTAVDMLWKLSEEKEPLSPIIDRINALMGTTISLRRLTINLSSKIIALGGIGRSESEVRAFKDKVEVDGAFVDVELPLRDFQPRLDGGVDFLVNFKLKGE